MFRLIRIGLACLITNVCFTSHSFGQTVENLPNAVRLTLAGGETVLAQVCGDRIVHVTAQPKGAPAIPASYVIDHSWSPVKFLVKSDDPSAVVLTTGGLTVRIDKATGAVSFQDAQGTPILNESDRSFTPVTVNKESTYRVQQSFHSPADESLYYYSVTWCKYLISNVWFAGDFCPLRPPPQRSPLKILAEFRKARST